MAELTESDERAIVIVTVDEDGTELPFSKVAIQQPVSTASPRDLTRDPADDDDTITVDAQRLDRFTENQALPLTMHAGGECLWHQIPPGPASDPDRRGTVRPADAGPAGADRRRPPPAARSSRPGRSKAGRSGKASPPSARVSRRSRTARSSRRSRTFPVSAGPMSAMPRSIPRRSSSSPACPRLSWRRRSGGGSRFRPHHPVRQQSDRPRRHSDRARDAAQPDRGRKHQAGTERRRGRQ